MAEELTEQQLVSNLVDHSRQAARAVDPAEAAVHLAEVERLQEELTAAEVAKRRQAANDRDPVEAEILLTPGLGAPYIFPEAVANKLGVDEAVVRTALDALYDEFCIAPKPGANNTDIYMLTHWGQLQAGELLAWGPKRAPVPLTKADEVAFLSGAITAAVGLRRRHPERSTEAHDRLEAIARHAAELGANEVEARARRARADGGASS